MMSQFTNLILIGFGISIALLFVFLLVNFFLKRIGGNKLWWFKGFFVLLLAVATYLSYPIVDDIAVHINGDPKAGIGPIIFTHLLTIFFAVIGVFYMILGYKKKRNQKSITFLKQLKETQFIVLFIFIFILGIFHLDYLFDFSQLFNPPPKETTYSIDIPYTFNFSLSKLPTNIRIGIETLETSRKISFNIREECYISHPFGFETYSGDFVTENNTTLHRLSYPELGDNTLLVVDEYGYTLPSGDCLTLSYEAKTYLEVDKETGYDETIYQTFYQEELDKAAEIMSTFEKNQKLQFSHSR